MKPLTLTPNMIFAFIVLIVSLLTTSRHAGRKAVLITKCRIDTNRGLGVSSVVLPD